MNISLGNDSDENICESIREKLVCGKCAASTQIVWKKPVIGERPKGSSLASIVIDNEGTERDYFYMIRCSFFRFNVAQPENISFCEAFKKKEI